MNKQGKPQVIVNNELIFQNNGFGQSFICL